MKKLLALVSTLFFSSLLLAQSTPISVTVGEMPAPEKVEKIISAGNPTDVVLLAVAPEKLAGLAGFRMNSPAGKFFPESFQKLETLGKVSGKNSTLSPEKILALNPNLIIDIGNISPNYIDQAHKTQAQTQIPYVLLDGNLTRTPELLHEIGKLIGKSAETEKLANYAEETLQQAVTLAPNFAKTAYLARGADGLETGFVGSIHTQSLELAGVRNVAVGDHKGLSKVSMEQILLWNPEIIFTQYPEFYQKVWTDPQWQALDAVKQKKVYLIPNKPFGWLDSPPSLNRLLGIKWLQHLLAGNAPEAFVPEIQQFYKLFYHIELSPTQAEALIKGNK
ncbi:iron ABC transporter substrate-binding protein [Pasteurellaceae bacterium Orientalotternb1]|nr:iron ABC transporter substrate-binding protein [Pasteurellaceae bacterium Orientalotternb1]